MEMGMQYCYNLTIMLKNNYYLCRPDWIDILPNLTDLVGYYLFYLIRSYLQASRVDKENLLMLYSRLGGTSQIP